MRNKTNREIVEALTLYSLANFEVRYTFSLFANLFFIHFYQLEILDKQLLVIVGESSEILEINIKFYWLKI
ncbi:hypothetical protein BpHYR1_038493 [Brachionus plicatilis]|uniref:Uncharacterized protein n=1 Tax=Brachionus plicatilis TaxID=10195 RepID=A0A3M7RAR8_BRAPC|nr:hypothetical protein BpHYR1_038493 [Brachionus plicatilis]